MGKLDANKLRKYDFVLPKEIKKYVCNISEYTWVRVCLLKNIGTFVLFNFYNKNQHFERNLKCPLCLGITMVKIRTN